jgi:hypothetical protein
MESRISRDKNEGGNPLILSGFGAGDGTRTRDVQLGKILFR